MWCNRTTIGHTRPPWRKVQTTIKNASTLANFILYPIILYRFTRQMMEEKSMHWLFFSMTLKLGTIVFSEHNVYNNSFFLVKTGILERIRFNIEYS